MLHGSTGGKFDPAPADILKDDLRQTPVEHELWPWLLLVALGLWIADVGVRRWPEKAAPPKDSARKTRVPTAGKGALAKV